MIRPLLGLALLAACGAPDLSPPADPPPAVPAELRVCPDKAAAPPALPPIITAEQLNAAHAAERAARQRDEERIAECRRRLERLNAWIDEHPPAP